MTDASTAAASPATSRSSVVLFLVPTIIWGTTWLAIKFQLGLVAPEVSVAWRFALASSLLLGFAALRGHRLRLSGREHLACAGLGLLLFGLNYVLVYRAEQSLTSASWRFSSPPWSSGTSSALASPSERRRRAR